MKNNNISAIYQAKYDVLHKLTRCHKKAVLLDKFIFWWQNSKYRLNNSNNIWFMKPYDVISEDMGIPLSTLKKYIKFLSDEGLIIRNNTFHAQNDNGFSVKKRTYIAITDKVLEALNTKVETTKPELKKQDTLECLNNQHLGTTDSIKMNLAIYKEEEKSISTVNNTVSNNVISSVEKNKKNISTFNTLQNQINSKINYPIEKQIGERITEELKHLIKGTLYNIQNQSEIAFSNPNQIFAEVVFAMTNESQLKGVVCVKARMNIIAKLLRLKQWKTPKGFYKYWDIGQMFQDKNMLRNERIKKQKESEIKASNAGTTNCIDVDKHQNKSVNTYPFAEFMSVKKESYVRNNKLKAIEERLNAIEQDIYREGRYLSSIKKRLDEGQIGATQSLVDAQMSRVASLYEQQTELEAQVEEQGVEIDLYAA